MLTGVQRLKLNSDQLKLILSLKTKESGLTRSFLILLLLFVIIIVSYYSASSSPVVKTSGSFVQVWSRQVS